MELASLSPNDLRHYLTQRIATAGPEDAAIVRRVNAGGGHIGPVLKSLDKVLNTVLELATGGFPRALLVAGASPKANAVPAAINLSRALVDSNEQVVLVDLTKGTCAVSGPLGMPRIPGFTDLAAGRAGFSDVVRVDDDSPLQVITAGSPTTRSPDPEPDSFMRLFDVLTQVYGCVVLHADLAAVEGLLPALRFELPAMVAVLPPRGNVENVKTALSTFQGLGCPVVVYGGSGKSRRSGLLGRIAAA
jgi:Mrp family chromosome partitioning ATPase